jgi:2-C-methyl-D-erythritol 4-phosphate cytidylyltransferase
LRNCQIIRVFYLFLKFDTSLKMKKTGVIIPAGGAGTRMGGNIPKQFVLLDRQPVMAHSIRAFRRALRDADIVVAIPPEHFEIWADLCLKYDIPHHKVCEGGATRFESVQRAIRELDSDCEYIAVHDAVRPLVAESLITHCFDMARKHGTAIPVLEVTDSIRRLTENYSYSVDRAELRAVQTPQVFRADILRTGYERAAGDNFTDDAAVVESIGYSIMLCTGQTRNIKLTHPVDLAIAETILKNDRH